MFAIRALSYDEVEKNLALLPHAIEAVNCLDVLAAHPGGFRGNPALAALLQSMVPVPKDKMLPIRSRWPG